MKAKSSETVAQVKAQILKLEGIQPEAQMQIYGGKSLEEGSTLAHYDIGEGITLKPVCHTSNRDFITLKPVTRPTVILKVQNNA